MRRAELGQQAAVVDHCLAILVPVVVLAGDRAEVLDELLHRVVVRVGDTVFDGSVSYQLEQARASMLDRSTHEIQSGRDRFSHPEGD